MKECVLQPEQKRKVYGVGYKQTNKREEDGERKRTRKARQGKSRQQCGAANELSDVAARERVLPRDWVTLQLIGGGRGRRRRR